MMKLTLVLISFVILTSCDFPEHYFSPIPHCVQTQNQEELTHEMGDWRIHLQGKSSEDYRYFFETFFEENGNSFMLINFRNKEACFTAPILVMKWDKLEGMKSTNGIAYPKELYDLKWEWQTINGEPTLIYLDMHKIID